MTFWSPNYFGDLIWTRYIEGTLLVGGIPSKSMFIHFNSKVFVLEVFVLEISAFEKFFISSK